MRIHSPGFRCLQLALAALFWAGLASAQDHRFEGIDRVVAIGDVHGAYEELLAVLEETGLIDEEQAWAGGGAHLVSVGDLLSRGDFGRQVMDLLMRLQDEARQAGGAVHVVLGNHEVMNLTGDLRYVSDGDYAQFVPEADDPGDDSPAAAAEDSLPAGFGERRAALAPDGRYGRWLLELPVMVVIDDTAFVHGGVSEMLGGLSLEEINRAAARDVRRFAEGWHALLDAGALADDDDFDAILDRIEEIGERGGDEANRAVARGMAEALKGLPFQPDGPLWYRGNSLCHPYAEIHVIDEVLEGLGARRVVVGHTPTHNRRITSRKDGRVFRIDTGMNHEAYQGRPAALVIEGDSVTARYTGEGAAEIVAEPPRVWPRPGGMSDEEIEQFLLSAEITGSEKIGRGVTRPQRLTLEKDGRTIRGVFKDIETDPGLQRSRRWDRRSDFADRYLYEVAAYRLDRLLDLHMVPVTVKREFDGREGSLQYWIEDAFNEVKRREQEIPFTGHCRLQPQYDLMNAFDILIFNVDRNLGDILYDQDWRLWLIDHSRAFGTQRGVPSMIDRRAVNVPPEFAAALERISMENLEVLEPYLQRRQLQALITRARWLRRQ